MPSNGVRALRLVESPPVLTPARSTAAKLGADPATTDLERRIGEAAAGAALAVAYGMTAYVTSGQLTDAARAVGGEQLARLAQLRLDTFGQIDNFASIAREQGRHTLYARHGAALRQHLNLDEVGLEKAFSELVCMAVSIAEKVAHDEQIFLRAQAN